MKAHTAMNRKIRSEASAIGLSAGQPKILDFLSAHDGSDQKSIASYCEIEPATVGSILLRMENAGLIIRRHSEGNRRSLYVYLTEKGQRFAHSMGDIFLHAEKEATEKIDDKELGQLIEMLEKIYSSLTGDIDA